MKRAIVAAVVALALGAAVLTWTRWPDRYGDLDRDLVDESHEFLESFKNDDSDAPESELQPREIEIEMDPSSSEGEGDPLRAYLVRALEAGSASPMSIPFESMNPWMREASIKGVEHLLTFQRLRAAADVDGLIRWMESQGCGLDPAMLDNQKYRASYEYNAGRPVPDGMTPDAMFRAAFNVEMTRNSEDFRPATIVSVRDPIDIAVALRTDPSDPYPMPSPGGTRGAVMSMFTNTARAAWPVWLCPGTEEELFDRDGQVLSMRASFIVRTRGNRTLPTHFVLDYDRAADQWRMRSMWIGNYVDKIYRTRY